MTEGLFCEIYVCPTSLQGDEKMKPIFSTEQARYQKFASFFIDVTGVSPFCVKVCATRKLSAGISRSAERDQGSAFGNRKLLEKLDQNFYKSAIARTTPSGYPLEIFAKLPRELGAGITRRHVAAALARKPRF